MKKNISLACRGGGIKSVSSAGVIKALEEMGYSISRVSGAGTGAIVAALYAAGFSAEDILHFFEKHWANYCKTPRFATSNGNGKIEFIENAIDEETGGKTFKDCTPLKICASKGNFIIHKPVVFSAETFPDLTLGKAVRASLSFPFLYQKCHLKYDGKSYHLLSGEITLNPLVETIGDNEVSVLSSFFDNKDKKENTHTFYASAWTQAEYVADLLIKPTIPLKDFASEDNLDFAFKRGFRKANQMVSLIAAKADV